MNDDESLLRYSRQILLPEFGIESQQRLTQSHALIVGAGGLGSPAAMYLAAAGIGQITIIDDDEVDSSNLQRQILHGETDVKRSKVESAKETLLSINSQLTVNAIHQRLNTATLTKQLKQIDLVLDCSDNFDTRFTVNDACWQHKVPLVSAAAIRFEGHLSVFDPTQKDSPCYRCLYPEQSNASEETCAENGILAPIVGVMGSLQALEAIKVLCKLGEPLCGTLLVFDGLHQEWRRIKIRQDPACPHHTG